MQSVKFAFTHIFPQSDCKHAVPYSSIVVSTAEVNMLHSLNTIWCLFLKLSNHPLDALNSLLSICLPISFAYSWSLVQNIGSFLPLTFIKHFHTVSLHSFQVFLTFLFTENLLQFSHWFLISNMAFNMSYTLCFPATVNFATLHFTVNFSFSLASVILLLC
jgi:hypothetical protein